MLNKLLLIISLSGVMGCAVSPSPEIPTIHLKDIKFPDEDFGKFIAANHIVKTEGTFIYPPQKDPQMVLIYDSLGRLIKRRLGNIMGSFTCNRYDENGLIIEQYDLECVAHTSSIRYKLYPQKRVLEETRHKDNGLKHVRNHLLDSAGRVILSLAGYPYELFFLSYSYDIEGNISKIFSTCFTMPGLTPVFNERYQSIKTFHYRNKKPAVVMQKDYRIEQYDKSLHTTTLKTYYDTHGLMKETIIDDTVVFSYTHQTSGDIDSSKFLLRVL